MELEGTPETTSPRGSPVHALKVAAVVAIVVVVVVAWRSGILRDLELETIRDRIRAAGAMGSLLYLLAFTVLQPMYVSAHAFVIAAALIWPPPMAFALACTGAFTSSHFAFGTARWLGRDFVQPRLPERIRRYDDVLATGGLRFLIGLKAIMYTSPHLQFALGVSRVPVRSFAIATFVGNMPQLLAGLAVGWWMAAG